ncbi:N-6 DNA methylase [Mesorhizobium sp.]|uniref:class I SAM-dependent DNA methyltransferase n=1 Tax=Mesorhizobium sp. TaxID=1871066 RepID=UPI000FE42227|nr:N-6 DNA methylase [Mesorhizobium sp.]RWN52721.1 MAG: SAM-dependent DNA methyltransferase [Mesorhizobium sp.]RWN78436.1 MAG: SAM-dependent DNA methyltransferase [Mesorhizobium sp.]RWN81040.1 MAG: SAM-dependent DNA methyltransferase [Mesorhizobium sp.]RWN85821.1 MAG: SAM-dependent DNA methyltransferase [Mesorhizobium sp.]RWO16246.1 MAG: SAM-dependent DNA methyltransferase [Mesorhizobium sp.]
MDANDIVGKLWRLCTILRKDGITYQQYVTELTYLLFLKMMKELGKEEDAKSDRKLVNIPKGMRWEDLVNANGIAQLQLYREMLTELGNPRSRVSKDGRLLSPPNVEDSPSDGERAKKEYDKAQALPRTVQAIFSNSSTFLRQPANLSELVNEIDKLHWFSTERDQFGDLYEGLLQKNAEETKRGAGQYFTPRVLIDAIVELMKPMPGEVIQDPAAGTGGFLIAADRYMKTHTDGYFELGSKEQAFQATQAFHGMENVAGTYRLLLMNLYLHGIDPIHVDLGDTLSPKGEDMEAANLILTNPPFGPSGGKPTREDLSITKTVSSYQLPFVEHCIRNLQPGGRAAMILPDNVLFEDGRGKQLRQKMMRECNVHTILRLPTGIFYAQGVKTNAVFLQRSKKADLARLKDDETQAIWIYDLRSQMPQFGRTSSFNAAHLKEFVQAYGDDPNGESQRKDEGPQGRLRKFTRKEIAARDDNLDIKWLSDEEELDEDALTEPVNITAAIMSHLEAAVAEIQALQDELTTGEAG